MDTFQKIILGISVFLLIFILIAVAMMMKLPTSTKVYPPIQQPCPDGWNSDSSGNCYFVGKNGGTAILKDGTYDEDVKKTIESDYPLYRANNDNGNITFASGDYPYGLSQPPPIKNSVKKTVIFNIKDPYWASQGGQTICAQKKFANHFNIYWDGISNTNQCTAD